MGFFFFASKHPSKVSILYSKVTLLRAEGSVLVTLVFQSICQFLIDIQRTILNLQTLLHYLGVRYGSKCPLGASVIA